jgi:hypothetical protein
MTFLGAYRAELKCWRGLSDSQWGLLCMFAAMVHMRMRGLNPDEVFLLNENPTPSELFYQAEH